MAARVLTAAVLSAVLMFLWGFVYWGPVLDASSKILSPLPADAELDVLAPLRSAGTPDGMYIYPGHVDMKDQKAVDQWTKKMAEGPLIHMAFRRSGMSPMEPMMYVKGLAHNFVVALLAAILLAMVAHALPSYGSRVGVLVLVAIIASIWTNVGNVIWWFHTPRYAAGQMIYELVAGLVMALVTAAVVRPRVGASVPVTP